MKKNSKKLLRLFIAIFFIQSINFFTLPAAKAVLSTCNNTNFTVEAKHNSVFYFDAGTTITANYVQFKITNKSNSTVSGYYAKLDNISGNKLSLANYEDAEHPFLANLNQNESVDMYWYLKTSGTDNGSTTFDISIYSGAPGASNGICQITSTISKIDSTISANANKLTSVIYQALPTANSDGSATFTATVKGQTGTIGAGPTGAKDVNLSPATTATFNARKFRLSGTSYRCGSSTPVLNQLYIPNACAGNYTAVFTYQYLTSATTAGATESLSPIMQIASGSQMKHTSTPSFTIAAIGTAPSNQVTTNAATNIYSSSATLNGTNDYGTYTSLYFCYSSTNPGSNFTNNCTNKLTATDDGNGNITANLTGLTNNTTYYFELTGETAGPTYTKGGVLSFLAKAYATTNNASNVAYTTVTLNGSQTGLTAANVDTAATYFYYTTTNPGSSRIDQSTASSIAATATDANNNVFTASLTGLNDSTTYYYEIVVKDIDAITYIGGVKSFATANRFTVTFNGNNPTTGSPSVASVKQATTGASVTLATKGTLDKTNYTFGGWNTNINGTGTNYNESATYTPTENITLYAKWTANAGATVTITFNPNSGTLASNQATDTGTVTAGNDALSVKPATNPTRSGFGFAGWNTDSGAATGLSSPVAANSDLTLYAIWTGNQYAYDGNTASGSTANQTYAGTTLTARNNGFTAPTGYSFGGWCSTSLASVGGSCTGNTYAAGANLPTPGSATVTLYAIWTLNPSYNVTYNGNGNSGGSIPSDANNYNNGATVTVLGNSGSLSLSGYTFDGWCTTQPAAGSSCGGTSRAASSTFTITANVTLYAVWQTVSSGGGGSSPAPAPVYVPNPPTITSIEKAPVCSKGSYLTINGTYLSGAKATVDGKAAQTVSSSSNSMYVYLPALDEGIKTLVVTNSDGTASTSVKYVYVANPVFQALEMKQSYKNRSWAYVFSASDAESWKINGQLPAGLVLDPNTGLISGMPTVEGIFVISISATNLCGTSTISVTLDIDKEIPNAYSCRISFPISSSNSISELKLAKLKQCFDKIKEISPRTIDPVTFLSGGLKPYQSLEEAVSEIDRYNIICELLTSAEIDSQIITGVFTGPEDEIELMAYWPEPEE